MNGTQARALQLVHPLAARPYVPDWHHLSAALCGRCADHRDDCLITRHVTGLVHLHQLLALEPQRAGDIETKRQTVIAHTDSWVTECIAPRRLTRSVGAALDKIAAAYVAAEAARKTIVIDGDNTTVLEIWDRYAKLLAHWDPFVDHVVNGRPYPWPDDMEL